MEAITRAQANQTVHMYAATVALDPAKTVRYVVLPEISDGQGGGSTALHVFALGIG